MNISLKKYCDKTMKLLNKIPLTFCKKNINININIITDIKDNLKQILERIIN